MSELAEFSSNGAPQVAYILKMFPRLSETFILNEVLELEAGGLPLHIFSLRRPVDAVVHEQARLVRSPISYLPERLVEGPMRLVRAQWHAWRSHQRTWRHSLRHALRRARGGGGWGELLAFAQACCVVREMGPVRHLHAHYANLPAKVALLVHRLAGVTYSVSTHAKDIFQNEPFASPKLQDRLCRASFVVANSEFSAGHIRAGLHGQGEVRVVYNGLDLAAFPRRRAEPSQPLLLGVGRLVEKKGFGDFIAAGRLLKDKGIGFSAEIVGTGALSQTLKEQSKAAGLSHIFRLTGPLPQHVLQGHYNRAVACVLPCKEAADGDRDILPNVLKEAMAVGVPVVTTRLEGVGELIEDGVSGLLVKPGDVGMLAQKLELLLVNEPLRQKLADNARKVIETRFDRRTNVARLRGYLETAAREAEFRGLESQPAISASYGASCVR